jgi:hypothetical protein
MRHVDEQACNESPDSTSSTQMMSSMLDLTKHSIVWSNCSVIELHEFLRSGDADCLFNQPEMTWNFLNRSLKFDDTLEQFDEKTKLNAIYPGENLYEIRKQCQQIFGMESDACEHQQYEDDCRILWCKVVDPIDEPGIHCVTSNTKWADGTRCGLNDPYV